MRRFITNQQVYLGEFYDRVKERKTYRQGRKCHRCGSLLRSSNPERYCDPCSRAKRDKKEHYYGNIQVPAFN